MSMLEVHDHHAATPSAPYDPPARISVEDPSRDQADATTHSSSRPTAIDPFSAWLARQPIGRPLTAKEHERLAEAKERIAAGAPRRSAGDLLAAARLLRDQ
jgi:hypothetical protein